MSLTRCEHQHIDDDPKRRRATVKTSGIYGNLQMELSLCKVHDCIRPKAKVLCWKNKKLPKSESFSATPIIKTSLTPAMLNQAMHETKHPTTTA